MKQTIIATLQAFAILSCISGIAESAKIKISTDPWSGAGIIYLAEAKGFFKAENLDVKIVYFKSYFDTIKAFNKGTIDTVQEALNDSIITAANGVRFIAPFVTVHNTGFDSIIVNPEKIKTLQDLKGKKIGYVKGQMGHYMLGKLLEKAGLTEKDIIGVPLSFKQVKISFEAGKIDGGCVNIFNESQKGKRIISSGDVPGSIDTLMFREEFMKRSPEKVKGIIKAWFRAVDFYLKNPDESIGIMAKGLKMSDEEFRKALSWAPIMKPETMPEYYTVNNKIGLIAKTAKDLHQFYIKTGFYTPEQKKNAETMMSELDVYFDPGFLKEIGIIK